MLCNIVWFRFKFFLDINFIFLLLVFMVVVIFCLRFGIVLVLGLIFELEDCLLDWFCFFCDCGLKSIIMKLFMVKFDYCGLCMW